MLQDQTESGKGHLREKEKSWVPLAPLGISQNTPALPAPHLSHPQNPPLTLPGVHPQWPEVLSRQKCATA